MGSSRRALRLGLIGCGRVVETRHLPALRSLAQAEVVALADVNPNRLRLVAERFHVASRYDDHRALLDNPAIDAVAVCVPPQFHVEVALAALEAGKHLFVEKPLALSLDESDRLIERAARSDRKIAVGFNLRWHRLARRARTLIRRGDLGPVELVRSVWTSGMRAHQTLPTWRQRRQSGGGVLVEVAVHQIDLWRFLLETEVEEVFATSRSGLWDDETATLTARMSNGVLTTSAYSDGTSDSNEVDVYGQHGRLHLSCYRLDGLEISPTSRLPGDVGTRIRGTARLLTALLSNMSIVRQGGDYVASYRAQWQHFIDCVQHDKAVECTLDDGRRALQVVLAAAASASLERPVEVGLAPRTIVPNAVSHTADHAFVTASPRH
jgi:myo-inositol 2-dehydrogenase/D-chiro-inositol 1-dehydrogenase